MIRTLTEAREAVTSEPQRWRACVYEATGTPLTERDDTLVHLFCLVKTAQERFRERIRELRDEGYKSVQGTQGSGLVKLERGKDSVWLAVDKRKGR